MQPGATIGHRFEIERRVDSGGMGTIYRAVDCRTKDPIAIKILRADIRGNLARFEREASLLAELRHAHIVRYIAHGSMDEGVPYLAMEWLDGVDLAHRLKDGSLDEREALSLARATAAALAHAHGLGIIHRDLKPRNLFLVRADPARVKIVDFGVAHVTNRSVITEPGGVVGTPGYMAPEQVRSIGPVDARSDLFALGCILFEALTGRPAFAAHDHVALLFKVLVEEPPLLRTVRPEASPVLEAIIDRLLSKNPGRRPESAAAVVRMFDALAAPAAAIAREPDATTAPPPMIASGLTTGEQRVVSVIVTAAAPRHPDATVTAKPDEHDGYRRTRIRNVAAQFGASVEWLHEGAMIAVIGGAPGHQVDPVVLAALCAQALHSELPGAPMAIGTGRAELRDAVPVGDVVDRAVDIVRTAPAASIVVDETTARLLELRFQVVDGRLVTRRSVPAGARTLLGRASPCVGRGRELANLHAILDGCFEDRRSSAVLVTGAAGVGKSRLVHEFVIGVRPRHPDIVVWSASADPVAGGAALWMVTQLLRGAAEIDVQEPADALMTRLRARMAGHVPEAQFDDVLALFTELLVVDRKRRSTQAEMAAPMDGAARAERFRRGFIALLAFECVHHPMLIVLDDLHWADGASLRLFDAVLGELEEAPMMVIGMARPEIRESFPSLWARRRLEELRLPNLRPQAALELARHALGSDIDEGLVTHAVARAEGNVFYLEELLRSVADGRGDALPETVLAMASARINSLEPEARRILRAGSVFGEDFTDSKVNALLDDCISRKELSDWLTVLVDREVLEHQYLDASASGVPYRFRHAYLRDAAYAMLTESDRALGHRLAAEWLERDPRSEPAVIAEHYERGRDTRAALHYLAAAQRASHWSDFDGALALSVRGTRIPHIGREMTAELHLLQAQTHMWRGDFAGVRKSAETLLALASPGTEMWWNAVTHSLRTTMIVGPRTRIRRNLQKFCAMTPDPEVSLAYWRAVAMLLPAINLTGETVISERLYQPLLEKMAPVAEYDSFIRGFLMRLSSERALAYCDDPWEALRLGRTAVALLNEADMRQAALLMQGWLTACLGDVAEFEAMEAEVRRLFPLSSHQGVGTPIGMAYLACNLAELGRTSSAREFIAWALERSVELKHPAAEGTARAGLATILLHEGRIDDAEQEACRAVRLAVTMPRFCAWGFTTLVRARLAQGRRSAALRASRAAMNLVNPPRSIGPSEVGIYLVHAEALSAAGDVPAARAAIEVARSRILARAARCSDPAARRRYLEHAPLVARTLLLAEQW